MDEKQISQLMQKLEISRDEAVEMLKEDEKIDKMRSIKEYENDLTDEQRKAQKKYKNVAKAVNAYGKTVTRTVKEDKDKKKLITAIYTMLTKARADVTITNPQREINFKWHNRTFKIMLSETGKYKKRS